ncbi:MAG TPA: hypothetical protein VIS57_12090 [Xanthomonadales bacterium]
MILIALQLLPIFFIYIRIGRLKKRERYQSIVVIVEIRALIIGLVVTKVMGCGDLFYAGGEANRIETKVIRFEVNCLGLEA